MKKDAHQILFVGFWLKDLFKAPIFRNYAFLGLILWSDHLVLHFRLFPLFLKFIFSMFQKAVPFSDRVRPICLPRQVPSLNLQYCFFCTVRDILFRTMKLLLVGELLQLDGGCKQAPMILFGLRQKILQYIQFSGSTQTIRSTLTPKCRAIC